MSDLNHTPLSIPELTEEQDIETVKASEPTIKYRETPKFNEWLRLFLDKSNKETFGNQTRSALIAYNLDEKTQYFSASQIGLKNIKKVRNLASVYLSKRGVEYGKMVDIIWNKMLASRSPDLWFMIMEMLGFETPQYRPISSPVYTINQINNNTVNETTVYANLTDEQLDAAIESKRRKVATSPVIDGERETATDESLKVHADS